MLRCEYFDMKSKFFGENFQFFFFVPLFRLFMHTQDSNRHKFFMRKFRNVTIHIPYAYIHHWINKLLSIFVVAGYFYVFNVFVVAVFRMLWNESFFFLPHRIEWLFLLVFKYAIYFSFRLANIHFFCLFNFTNLLKWVNRTSAAGLPFSDKHSNSISRSSVVTI